ncbi:MAG: YigZ family protein [Melioribacteraceae bacterium]|nr:YigZ family protein [Melioribacteraceae bacterium]
MKLPIEIRTISNETEFKLKEKGSLFIAKSFPINSEDEINNKLFLIKKEFYDANHHCYSYKLQNGIFKYSDDGEPNGTAGIRIFNAQNHFQLTNILTVVIRYFGGVKLGVGPLGKAYYETAFESLLKSKVYTLELYQKVIFTYDFSQSKTIHHFISKFNLKIIENKYSNLPQITALIKVSLLQDFIDAISNYSPLIKFNLEDEFEYLEKKDN